MSWFQGAYDEKQPRAGCILEVLGAIAFAVIILTWVLAR